MWLSDSVIDVQVRSVAAVLAEIERKPAGGAGIRLVGIDGPSGSGKTTLARLLSEHSGAPIVSIDDFLSWSDLETWWPRFDTEVLIPLLDGRDAHYRVRDWAGDELGSSVGSWKTTPWNRLVIIDGVTCTRRAAAVALTYRIWTEAPEPVRLARGLARDGETHRELWQAWMTRERDFFARDQTRSRADVVVNSHSNVEHDQRCAVVVESR